MRAFKQLVLAGIVSLATSGVVHADLILTRAPNEAIVVVQNCAATCSIAGTLTLAELKRIERQVAWRGYARMLAFSSPAFIPWPPTVFLNDYVTFSRVSAELRTLRRTPGAMRINAVESGFNDVYQLIIHALPALPTT